MPCPERGGLAIIRSIKIKHAERDFETRQREDDGGTKQTIEASDNKERGYYRLNTS